MADIVHKVDGIQETIQTGLLVDDQI